MDLMHTHAEMAVLRMLVETLITNLPPEVHSYLLEAFQEQCDRCMAELIGSTGSDNLIVAMERAIPMQLVRLRAALGD